VTSVPALLIRISIRRLVHHGIDKLLDAVFVSHVKHCVHGLAAIGIERFCNRFSLVSLNVGAYDRNARTG